MNELLITQLQAVKSANPAPYEAKGKGSRDKGFDKLVSGEIKKHERKTSPELPGKEPEVPIIQDAVLVWPLPPPVPTQLMPQVDQAEMPESAAKGQTPQLFETRMVTPPQNPAEGARSESKTLPQKQEQALSFELVFAEKPSAERQEAEAAMTPEERPALESLFVKEAPQAEPGKEENPALLQKPAEKLGAEADAAVQTDGSNVDIKELAIRSLENMKSPAAAEESIDVDEPDFAEKVSEKIIYRTEGGAKHFEIELSPRELGKVKISVVFENGKAAVSLFCENAKTQQILSSHAENIRSLVEQSSKYETNIHIRRQSEEQTWQENQNGGNQNKDRRQQQSRRPKREEMSFFIDQLKSDMILSAG